MRRFGEPTFWFAAFLPILFLLALGAFAAAAGTHRHPRSGYEPADEAAVIRDLQSSDVYTRRRAASALFAVEPLSPEAIAAALQALRQPDPMGMVQRQVVAALGKTGALAIPALTEILEGKEGDDPGLRVDAVYALGAMASREPAAGPPLIAALKDPRLQILAAQQIARMGVTAVPLLRNALHDPDPQVRRGAVEALQMAAGQAAQATPELTDELKEADPNVRFLAAADLARIGPEAKSVAAPALAALLKDPKPEVRAEAVVALARVDPENTASLPLLIEALEDDRSVAHWDAVDALRGMHGNARPAVPALEHLLATDHDPQFRIAIAGALGPIDGLDAVPALVRTLTGDNEIQVRRAALDAIVSLGPGATAAIPGLVEALRASGGSHDAAADALAAMGRPAIPALLAALHSPDLYTREGAITALSKSKPLADDVTRALTAVASDDKSALVRFDAAEVLDRAGIAGGHAALEKAQQQMYAAMTESPAVDTKRLYRRQEIFADIAPDDNHEYPLRLIYLVAFGAPRAEMFAAVYRGKDRRDRLIFWRQTGDDRYQQMQAIDAGPDASDSFDPPKVIFIPRGQVPGLGVRFVDVGVNLWRGHGDYVFAIDGDELWLVEMESPERWYRDQLRPGEEIVGPWGNSFCNREARFGFYVRQGKKTEQVVGTYKVVREIAAGSGPVIGGLFGVNRGKTIAGNPPTIWKLVPDSARREPIHHADR